LRRRDGARLHAGLVPGADLDRITRKIDFLVASGLPRADAQMAMLAAGRFTIGSVLEEQAAVRNSDPDAAVPVIDHEAAFEAGLGMIVDGLALRRTDSVQ
jgi:TetR/AcrR family tetracycline transcriptional repressor